MNSTKTLLIGAMLGVAVIGSPQSIAATKDPESADIQGEIKTLQDQLAALQARLDAQAATQKQLAAQTAAAASPPSNASAPIDKIHYKGVTITLGGFVEGASVYRSHDTNTDVGTAFNTVPFNSVSTEDTNQFLMTARQSRFSALAQADVNSATHLAGYVEMDFLGAAQTANSKETNSYNPRVRHVYGTLDWDNTGMHFLAGQTYSLATLNGFGILPGNESLPATIDAQFMPGTVWVRQPQVRFTKDFDKKLWLALSFENPQTTFYTGANALPKTVALTYQATGNGNGYNSANTLSLNHLPDVIAKAAYEVPLPGRTLHVEAFGLYSDFYERLDYANVNTSGGGWGVGLVLPVLPKVLEFQIASLAGKGIGRYGSGQLTEVTFDPTGHIAPIHETIALTGFNWHPTPWLDAFLFAGREKASAQSYDLTTSTGEVAYGYGNPLYSNTGCVSETATGGCVGNESLVEQATIGLWFKPYVGSFGKVKVGTQYSHTEFQTFEGKGGAPVAILNAVFLSFRWYPF